MTTAIRSWRGGEEEKEDEEEKLWRATLKSNNPHLASEEKTSNCHMWVAMNILRIPYLLAITGCEPQISQGPPL